MVMVMMHLYKVWPLPYFLPFRIPILLILLIPFLLLLVVLVPGSFLLLLELAMAPPALPILALLLPAVTSSVSLFQLSVHAGLTILFMTTMLDGDISSQVWLPVPFPPPMVMTM